MDGKLLAFFGIAIVLIITPGPDTKWLTVVGIASSVTDSAGGWVTPAEIAKLRSAGGLGASQVLYRFRSAGSAAALRVDIATVARGYGAETPFVRPPELSDEHTGTVAVTGHALTWLAGHGCDAELVCCVYATAPFLTAEDLRRGHDALIASGVVCSTERKR